MNLDFKKDNDIGIIKITGRLVVSNAREFKEEISKYIEQSRFLVLDLTDMDYIDSLGLGSLINCYKTITENDGDPKVYGVFEIRFTNGSVTKISDGIVAIEIGSVTPSNILLETADNMLLETGDIALLE